MFGFYGIGFGIVLMLFGAFAVFFFPSSLYHQEEEMSIGGVIMGVIALIVGAALIFF